MNLTRLFGNSTQSEPMTSAEFRERLFAGSSTISKNRAMQITTVFGCDRILMETTSSVGLHLYREIKEGKEKAKDKILYNLLYLQPNPNMTSATWRKMMIHDINMRGTHYAQLMHNRRGDVIRINPLRHDNMEIRRDKNNKIFFVYHSAKYGLVQIPKNKLLKVFAIPDEENDGETGVTPIKRAMREFKYADTLQNFGQNWFDRGAAPSGVFKKDGILDQAAYDRLKGDLKKTYTGLMNNGTPMLLEDSLTFEPLTIANNESQFLESKKFSKEQIASIFRVPLHLLNGLDNATFSNIEQLSQEFLQFTMLPWFTTIEQELMTTLLTKEEQKEYKILFNMDTLLRGDYKTRTEGHANLFRIGVMSPNEIRRYEGRNTIGNGDNYYVEMNMTTTENLNKEGNS